jgi:transcriptional regulator NrdR family protein
LIKKDELVFITPLKTRNPYNSNPWLLLNKSLEKNNVNQDEVHKKVLKVITNLKVNMPHELLRKNLELLSKF